MPRNHRRVTENAKSESVEESEPELPVKVFVEEMKKVQKQLLRMSPEGMDAYKKVMEIDYGVVPLTDFPRYLKGFFKSIGINQPTRVKSNKGYFYEGSNDKFAVGAGMRVDERNRTQVFMHVNRHEE